MTEVELCQGINIRQLCDEQYNAYYRKCCSFQGVLPEMFKFLKKSEKISIEKGTWYYFTVDLSFTAFASFSFVRYINVNGDRKAAIVRFLDKDYFSTRDLLLLPYTRKKDYFKAGPDEILSVWTFDASKVGDARTIDLESDWPKNILDKAAITPSIERAKKATGQ